MSAVTVVVGTIKGTFLVRADRARTSWKVEGPLMKGWKATSVGPDGAGGYVLATASDVYGCAVHRSTNFVDWRQVETGPAYDAGSGFKLNQIWKLVDVGARLYAGVDEAGLFESPDHGETWTQVRGLTAQESRKKWFPGFGGLCAHSLLAGDGGRRLWVGISAVGVFRSDDGGATWNSKNAGVPQVIPDDEHPEIGYCVHALVQDPTDHNTIWRQDHRGMFRTQDGGERWERIENGLPSGFGFPIVFEPRTRTLFAFPLESDEYRIPKDGKLRVFHSKDGGDSWAPLANGLPDEPFYETVLRQAMAVDTCDPAGVYVGTTGGNLFWSNDVGASWQRLPAAFPRILCVEAFAEA